jgi:hypothetical protein
MPVEAEQTQYDHIGDADTVYITHPDTEGVGTSRGAAFKKVWAKKGWTQTTREAYEEHLERLRGEVGEFIASGDAELPPEGGDAQDVIMGERGDREAETRAMLADKPRHAGGATSTTKEV